MNQTKYCPTHYELFPKENPHRYTFEFYDTPSRNDDLSSHCIRCTKIVRKIKRKGTRRAPNTPNGRVEIYASIPPSLKDRVTSYAEERGISKSRVVNEALEFYLDELT